MRDDQMVRRIDGRLHIIADHAGAAPAGRHRAGIRIGEGDLLIGRGQHHFLNRFEALRHRRGGVGVEMCISFRLDLTVLRRDRAS